MQNCKSLVVHTDIPDRSTIKQIIFKLYVCVLIILEWKGNQWESISLSLNDISWRANSMHWEDLRCLKHEAWTSLLQILEHYSKVLRNFPFNWLIKECRDYKFPIKSQLINICSGKTKPIVLKTFWNYTWSNKSHGNIWIMGE